MRLPLKFFISFVNCYSSPDEMGFDKLKGNSQAKSLNFLDVLLIFAAGLFQFNYLSAI